jgi:hypothetical protein
MQTWVIPSQVETEAMVWFRLSSWSSRVKVISHPTTDFTIVFGNLTNVTNIRSDHFFLGNVRSANIH